MMRVGLSLLFCLFCVLGNSQKTKLANQYYQSGEYEKAGGIYKALYEESNRNDYYFNKYIDCLLAVDEFDTAESAISKIIKDRPKDVQFYVTLGKLYEKQDKVELAEKTFNDAIDNMGTSITVISKLGNAFQSLRKTKFAVKVFLKGQEIAAPKDMFSYNIAAAYRDLGQTDKMIEYYLISLNNNPNRLNGIKNQLVRVLDEPGFAALTTQLYTQIQEHPDQPTFVDLLQWVFIQQKDYDKALRQARSLDRKYEENGQRVYELSETARKDKDYSTALKGYNYIIDNKGSNSSYYFDAKKKLLDVKKKEIIEDYIYTKDDFIPLEMEYDTFLLEFGKNAQTAWLMMDFAKLEANYMDNLPKATSILEEIVDLKGINDLTRATAKLSLGDYYLMQEEKWEATLLYSQVDKTYKEEVIGERARFKNAMLSYYTGDFGWAQEQFDILKAATSRLISNDAIDMSVFIMDNMGLDTTDVPLQMFAKAELMIFQNKLDEAFVVLDTIKSRYKEHTLLDDILYKKAQIYVKKQEYNKAITNYEQIIEKHVEEIRCDNAIYELAQLYEFQMQQPDKAQELYKKLFIDFSNSTLAVEGRKRYRFLRGDEVQ